MTDNEPRQLLPETESHQQLSAKLGASRPPPPRSRSNRANQSTSKQPSSATTTSAAPDASRSSNHDDAENQPAERERESAAEPSDAPDDEASSELEASGSASPVRMTVQRAVSGTSIRSSRSIGAVSDIPKDEIEKALEGLDRDDLVLALGRAKVQMDEIEARLDEQLLENETLHDSTASLTQQLGSAEHEVQSLHALVKQREERIDEMMLEQERIEGEVYSTMQIIERLRKQLADSERGRNDAEKRYLDQTATMDKERQYYMDTEALLKSQKATQSAAYEKLLTGHNELLREHERLTNNLASIKANGVSADPTSPITPHKDLTHDIASKSSDSAHDVSSDSIHTGADTDASAKQSHTISSRGASNKAATFAEERDMAAMIEELSTLQKSHSSLSETMVTLQTELKDVRAENVALRDQNETFMDILQEKTFSGALLNESAMLRGMRSASFGRLRAQDGLLDPYDEEGDDDDEDSLDVDDSADDSAAGGSSIASRTIPEEDEDDVDDVPDTPKAPPKPKLKASRRKRAGSSAAPLPTADLASELEGSSAQQHASPDDRAVRGRRSPSQRFGVVSDNLGELQNEVRELREANQALTLYISKIIDRIIAREGYENILAVESRGTVRGPRHKASRAKLAQSAQAQGGGNTEKAAKASSAAGADASGQASGLFGFGGASNRSASGGSRTSAPPKSKRASSIDWRSLPFLGGGGGSGGGGGGAGETSSNLRPLTLQSDNLLVPPRDGSARKLRTSEEIEDEHDVAERERIRNELISRGIQPPKHQLVQSPTSPRKQRPQSVSGAAGGTGGFAAFFSRVVGGASSNAIASPGKSDTQSQASTTPGGSFDTGFERAVSSTPAADAGRREAERTRALQLSEGGSSVTKLSSGPGIASKARQLRAERHQQTLIAADGAEYPFPSSAHSSAAASRATSGSNSIADSSIWETSIAGDESYTLPPPPSEGGGARGDVESVDSPLVGYGAGLPPLPHETTGDEDPEMFRSPSLAQNKQLPNASQDQGWKRAFRRISLLSPSATPAQPDAGFGDAASHSQSPIDAPGSESAAEEAHANSNG